MLPPELVEQVVDTVSGIRAVDYTADISRFHRIQASPGIHDAIMYIKSQAEALPGLAVTVHEYRAEGQGAIGTWEELYTWKPRSGILQLLEPAKKTLADFETEPISLAAQSRSADITTEVVYVGKGVSDSDYDGKEVGGKLVLTESKASLVHKIACIEHGAAGVLTYVPPSGTDEIAGMRRYEGLWPEPGEGEKAKLGFALRQADGLKIKQWLQEGKTVRVHAKVDAELEPGPFELLSAVIPGKDTSREVWLMAHVCHPHPGANDNASGAGAILEVLRAISRLISSGKIDTPDNSIRCFWVPEWHGTIKLIEHDRNLVSRCRALINVDMVGGDPAKTGSVLGLHRTPYSLPTTLNNVVEYWLSTERERKREPGLGGTICPLPFEYRVYEGGSDHFLFTDSNVRVPAVMVLQWPDKFYHTSADTPDKIDPQQMAYVARSLVLSVLSFTMPMLVSKEELMTLCKKEIVELIERVGLKAVHQLSRCTDDPEKLYPRYMRWLTYASELGRQTLDRMQEEWHLISEQKSLLQAMRASIEMAYTSEMVILRKAYEGACVEVGLQAKDEGQIRLNPMAFDVHVRRKTKHAMIPSHIPMSSKERLARYMPLTQDDPFFMSRVDELLNLSHEWKLLNEIWERLCFEFGDFDPKTLSMVVKDLEQLGIIETREV